jgi:trigger factor
VKTTVETLEDNKVKLSVSVGEDEFEPQIDEAFKRIAREVRIPGFRPGKAPRRVLEARLGAGVAREEALREAVPDYYQRAVGDHEVDAIAAPEIDITGGQEDGAVEFDAVVEVRPKVSIGGYDSLRVTIPSPVPTDDEIDQQVDRLRDNFASLETVERPAQAGDHVLIDILGSQDGEPLDGLTADDYVYELGAEAIVPEIDEHLAGKKPGDIVEFDADHPDPDEDQLQFRILVKEVQAKVLPEADDAWAAESSEFDTIDELRADLAKRAGMVRIIQAQMALREKTADALGELVDVDLPEPLVASEMQNRVQDMAMRLEAQGASIDQYLEATGQSQDDLVTELRSMADPAVRADLALRAVAEAEGIEADDDDLDEEFDGLAQRLELPVGDVREQLERGGQVPALRSDIKKRKALEWVIERVEVVDDDGNVIDRDDLETPSPDDDDEAAAEADPTAASDDDTPSDTASAPDTSEEEPDTSSKEESA